MDGRVIESGNTDADQREFLPKILDLEFRLPVAELVLNQRLHFGSVLVKVRLEVLVKRPLGLRRTGRFCLDQDIGVTAGRRKKDFTGKIPFRRVFGGHVPQRSEDRIGNDYFLIRTEKAHLIFVLLVAGWRPAIDRIHESVDCDIFRRREVARVRPRLGLLKSF
jgi:hypothetical protein